MMTNVVENGRMKCHQYWEREESKQATYGHLLVITEKVELKENWTTSSLRIMNLKVKTTKFSAKNLNLKLNARPQTEETRNVSHFHFTNWADNESPTSTGSLLALIKEIRKQQIEMLNAVKESWNGDPRGPSIVVHCSAGIGRTGKFEWCYEFESKINEKFSSTGTFITVDISIARLEAEGKVDIRGTVEKLRNQRAYSVQAISQYSYCHRALIDYAIEEKFLESYKNFEDIFERNSSNVSYLTFFISSWQSIPRCVIQTREIFVLMILLVLTKAT